MSFGIDISYSLRQLIKKPFFTITSIVIVAFGLGISVYTYSLLSQLIFKPLMLGANTEIISVEGEFKKAYGREMPIDPFHLNQIRSESQLLDKMSMYATGIQIISTGGQHSITRKFSASYNEWNFFEVAGVQPILGRGFSPKDQEVGAESVIVLSEKVWRTHFNADPDIIGKSIQANGSRGKTLQENSPTTRIIGIMPEGFSLPAVAEVWLPLSDNEIDPLQPSTSAREHVLALATLKSGVSKKEFQEEVIYLLEKHFKSLPQELASRANSAQSYINILPFKLTENAVYQHYPVFIALMIVVGLIVLLACINIGNMLLSRVNERIKDVAIRIALGIPRQRLLFQMLWESIFICCLGGILAIFLANWSIEMTNNIIEKIFSVTGLRPFWWHIQLTNDAFVLLVFALILMIFLTGILPAWRAISSDFNAVLRDGTRGALGKKASRANKLVVITEVALSCVVLVVAVILLNASHSAKVADYGVETENRLVAAIRLPVNGYPWNGGTTEAKNQRYDFYSNLQEQLESLPNIKSVAYFSSLPGSGGGYTSYEIKGRQTEADDESYKWNFEVTGIGSWSTIGMHILEGRDFNINDINSEHSPIIINAAMAKDHFPDGNVLGQQIRTFRGSWHTEWRTIIGIVSDSVHGSTIQTSSAKHTGYGIMYRRTWPVSIVIHYVGLKSEAEAALFDTLNNVDPDVAAFYVQSYDEVIAEPMIMIESVNTIFLWCGLIAAFLAASGIYAISSNSIEVRKQEIATRRALGANNKQIITLFLKQAGLQIFLGLAVGLSISLLIATEISSSIVLSSDDYLVGLVSIPLAISITVLLATVIPTTKITKQEPADGLRQD